VALGNPPRLTVNFFLKKLQLSRFPKLTKVEKVIRITVGSGVRQLRQLLLACRRPIVFLSSFFRITVMRLAKFLVAILMGFVLTVGCTKSEPVSTAPVEKPAQPKFQPVEKTSGEFPVPENMSLDGGVRDVEK
jgi:hypothetical protein